MLLSLRRNGLTSLFKEVTGFSRNGKDRSAFPWTRSNYCCTRAVPEVQGDEILNFVRGERTWAIAI